MVIIVAHHYVVNSGLLPMIEADGKMGINDIFLLLFGWGGKTGINCFVLITGYFMCTSTITVKKYIKLVGARYFYALLFFVIFLLSGYTTFNTRSFLEVVFPFFFIKDGFISCYLLFYLFIPFLNRLIYTLTEKEHLILVGLCLSVYTILPSFINAQVSFNYITWFSILYLIASYFRLYPNRIWNYTRLWGLLFLICLALSWTSVIVLEILKGKWSLSASSYFLVADSNKILALTTAVCAFLFFKNIKIKQSQIINTVATSTFGVLLIHANSEIMRQWLWGDALKNIEFYSSPWLFIHAIASVAGIYIVCTIIDQIRIRWIEIPLLKKIK